MSTEHEFGSPKSMGSELLWCWILTSRQNRPLVVSTQQMHQNQQNSCHNSLKNAYLVGGFNPSEKYVSWDGDIPN